MITLGQAACLVYDLEPTKENRKKVKELEEGSLLGVCYLEGNNYLEPIAIAKTKISRNPFKYKTYPNTPPQSPQLVPSKEKYENSNDIENDSINDLSSISSSSTKEDSDDYTYENIWNATKIFFSAKDPNNSELYDYDFFTNNDMYEGVEKQLPKLKEVMSLHQFGILINKYNDIIGELRQKRVNKSVIRGRYLYKLKDLSYDSLVENKKKFKDYVKKAKGNWINIGYCRKSPSSETEDGRKRLLMMMKDRLIRKCFCEKIFISTCCSSSDSILARDYIESHSDILDNGNTQFRLCIIDYSGLSTDTNDIRNMLKMYKVIKEVVVLHKSSIKVLERWALINDDKIINKFNCRKGPVHRSK